MQSTSPVLTEKEIEAEQVIALNQPEYFPIIVARVIFSDGTPCSMTRFSFSAEERALISQGADLILGQPHHRALMPISLQLAMPNSYPSSLG